MFRRRSFVTGILSLTVHLLIVTFVRVQGESCDKPDATIAPSKYPCPKRDENVSDTYPKNTVAKDPYRSLENVNSEETKTFIKAEMAITTPYLNQYPDREQIKNRGNDLQSAPKYYFGIRAAKRYFFFQNDGQQNQDVFYVQDSLASEPKSFLDPNILTKDGSVFPEDIFFSYDGSILAYALSLGGSDTKTVQFKHVEKGDFYKEQLVDVKFSSLSWTHNNMGIFYAGYYEAAGKPASSGNDANKNHKLYYHVLGTDQTKDVLMAEFPDQPDFIIDAQVTFDGKYLIIHLRQGMQNALVYMADLDKIKCEIKGKLDLVPLVTKLEAAYKYVTNTENIFIFLTNKGADNYKLITIDITNPSPQSWKDLVPENEKDALDTATAVYDNYMILSYIHDVKSVLQLHDTKTGKLIKKFDLEIGTINYVYGDKRYQDVFLSFESFFTPGRIYHCDLSKPPFDLDIFKETKLNNFDEKNFIAEQVFYPSKDGTKIPMFIVHEKDVKKNGNNPTILYGYGSHGVSLTPSFKVSRVLFISNFHGIYVTACVRGGGEYGEQWHRAGQLENKQNSATDFQAAAEYLISEKYTNTKLLTIYGSASGGVLIGACINQRPDLFGIAVVKGGIFDMLRYDKFTGGSVGIPEYGSPSNETQFEFLYKFSPLHNVNFSQCPNRQYPATLLYTAQDDDHIPALHTLKFIATLQYQAKSHSNQKNALLLCVQSVKHSSSNLSMERSVSEIVDMMSFIAINTGIKFST